MRTLYLECNMGAAGDMLTAALLELHPRPDEVIERLNRLGIPGVELRAERAETCGIVGTHVAVAVNGGSEEAHDHEHSHGHGHGHDHHHHVASHHRVHEHAHDEANHDHHHHAGLGDIETLIGGLELPDRVRADAIAVYRLIAQAESHAHGRPVEQIHFHEVGTMDAVADVVGACLLVHELGSERIVASPVHVGSGQVRCAHGILPVPAPATAHILRGVPTYGGQVDGELCTPTGAALLKHFATHFGPMPVMEVEKIGYGIGTKRFSQANCVRAMLGSEAQQGGQVVELCCNIDDMTGEDLGYAAAKLLDGGALDVFITPVYMKKNRPGSLLTCLCSLEQREHMLRLIFQHTTTIGVREHSTTRYTLSRREVTLRCGDETVRAKESAGYGIRRVKAEFDDLAAIADRRGCSLKEVRDGLTEA